MRLYDKYILPKITNFCCGGSPTMKQRQKVVPICQGDVLEIGFGSGLNLQYYNEDNVRRIFGLDPSMEMWNLSKAQIDHLQIDFEFIQAFADKIPLTDNSIDDVLITYTLCSIPNAIQSLTEIRRVLKPEGRLIFCEHGLAPDQTVIRTQKLINPIWRRLGGGCNLTKDIPKIIQEGGFEISKLETMYIPGFKAASYNYWGHATPQNI